MEKKILSAKEVDKLFAEMDERLVNMDLMTLARLARNFSAAMKHVEHRCDEVQALYVRECWKDLDARLNELLGPEYDKRPKKESQS